MVKEQVIIGNYKVTESSATTPNNCEIRYAALHNHNLIRRLREVAIGGFKLKNNIEPKNLYYIFTSGDFMKMIATDETLVGENL